MKKLIENFRKFEQKTLEEGRPSIRFPNLDVTDRPDSMIQPLRTPRQIKIFAKKTEQKYIQAIERLYKAAKENENLILKLPYKSLRFAAASGRPFNEVKGVVRAKAREYGEGIEEGYLDAMERQEERGNISRLSDTLESLGFYMDPVGAYLIDNTEHSQGPIKQHEGMHVIFMNIKEHYGPEAKKWVLKQMINILKDEAPLAANHIANSLITNYGYRQDDTFFEEVINFTHTILTSKRTRQQFFSWAGTENETTPIRTNRGTTSHRELISNLKRAWKHIVGWANRLQPEDLPQ